MVGQVVRLRVSWVLQMSIQDRQTQPDSLILLAAQRHLYSRAKRVRNISVMIIVGIAILGLIASVIENQQFAHLLASLALLSWLFDQRVLATKEHALRTEAATIQEAFDCFVLDLPWPSYKGVHRPTNDRVKQLAMTATDAGPLENWYPPDSIPADPMMARLHCQRTNCWWDVTLREKWIGFLRTLFWALLAVLVLLSASTGITVAKLTAVFASNIRVIAWGLNECDNQAAAIGRLHAIHSFISSFRVEQPPSAVEIRGVQDAVFDHRRSTPPVPDWFYWWHRRVQEREAGGRLRS